MRSLDEIELSPPAGLPARPTLYLKRPSRCRHDKQRHPVEHRVFGRMLRMRMRTDAAQKPTEEQYERALKRAPERGADDGKRAARWWEQDAIGGRVSRAGEAAATARRVLAGIEKGDPEILDQLPKFPTGGGRVGDMALTAAALVEECWEGVGIEGEDYDALAEADDEDGFAEICEAYEDAFNLTSQDAIERACGDVVARLADEPPSTTGSYLYRCTGCGQTTWIGI